MAEKEVSIIVSSHNLHEIEGLCDHVGLINGQKLALDCSIQEISQNRCKFRLAFNREMTQQVLPVWKSSGLKGWQHDPFNHSRGAGAN